MKDDMAQIIGNGMIAKSFSNYVFSKDCLIIASGVSNSLESRTTEFEREEHLVIEAIRRSDASKVIYFSTCSIVQEVKTPYIHHKMRMEEVIAQESRAHLIFRLPQAVGVVKNSTLISYLVTQLLNDKNIIIQQKAKRNLIDVCDVARIVHRIIEENVVTDSVIHIASKKAVFVADIVNEIAKILKKSYSSSFVNVGEAYDIPIEFIEQYLPDTEPLFNEKYWVNVLLKYVPLIAKSAQFHQ